MQSSITSMCINPQTKYITKWNVYMLRQSKTKGCLVGGNGGWGMGKVIIKHVWLGVGNAIIV